MDNAYPDSVAAWAALLLVHNRRLPATRVDQRVYYGLSYDRSLFEHFGRFREDLRAGEDTEFNGRFEGRRNTVLATDAVTGHRYPTEFRPMLADAFRRGRLQARLQGAIAGRRPRGFRVALRGPRNALASLMVSLRSPRPQRERLLRALPLAVAAGIVYSCGALTARAADPVERSSRLA